MRTGLIEEQWLFLQDVALLIRFASQIPGVQLTLGGAFQANDWYYDNCKGKTPHLKGGQHPKRLAVDLNLFVDGRWIKNGHHVWDMLGEFWKRLNPLRNRWGGDFTNVSDFNHFERVTWDIQ